MGEPNAALGVYVNHPDRIRSVLEYYLAQKLPEDWKYEELKGLYTVRDSKEKLMYRQKTSGVCDKRRKRGGGSGSALYCFF